MRQRRELKGVDRVFVAIDAAHISNATKKGLRRDAWPARGRRGVPFVFKEPNGPGGRWRGNKVEDTLLGDAIVDRTLCVRAKWFVGWPGSTFFNQITLSRRFALGANASNYYYNPQGVFPRPDDGRMVNRAYDRARPGQKKPRGAPVSETLGIRPGRRRPNVPWEGPGKAPAGAPLLDTLGMRPV